MKAASEFRAFEAALPSRIRAGSDHGRSMNGSPRRHLFPEPASGSDAAMKSGSGCSTVSTTARTARKGTFRSRQASATQKLSISTARASVSEPSRLFVSGRETSREAVTQAPVRWRSPIVARTLSALSLNVRSASSASLILGFRSPSRTSSAGIRTWATTRSPARWPATSPPAKPRERTALGRSSSRTARVAASALDSAHAAYDKHGLAASGATLIDFMRTGRRGLAPTAGLEDASRLLRQSHHQRQVAPHFSSWLRRRRACRSHPSPGPRRPWDC